MELETMIKRLILPLALAAAWLSSPFSVKADPPVYAQTVSACGTPNNTPVVGNPYPVTMDTTGTLCTAAGGGGGGGAVYGPNAVGSAAAHPPVITGGTANAAATGNVQVIKVDSSGNQYVVCSACASTTTDTNTGTIAGAVTSSVMQSNTKQVNGVTTLAGAGAVGTGAQRVAVGQDTTTIAGSAPGTAGSASSNVLTVQGVASMTPVQVSQATASSLNATVVGAGSAGSANAGVETIQGIASMTPVQIGGGQTPTSTISATNAVPSTLYTSLNGGTVGLWTATNADALAANSTANNLATADKIFIYNGTNFDRWRSATNANNTSGTGVAAVNAMGLAQSSEPAAATTTNQVEGLRDLVGKDVTSPYANRENMIRGYASSTGTGATTLNAAAGVGVKNYVTDLTCTRSDAGTTAISVTLSDSASTVIDIPNNGGGGGFSHTYGVPLVTAANTAFTFTSGTGVTTLHCSDTGFTGY